MEPQGVVSYLLSSRIMGIRHQDSPDGPRLDRFVLRDSEPRLTGSSRCLRGLTLKCVALEMILCKRSMALGSLLNFKLWRLIMH